MGIFVLFFILYTDFKGIWIPRWSITDHSKILACLDGKFNHIFLQVFALGEAYYPSKYAPSKMRSDTWLKEFLDEAHRREIKVSAWINALYSWGYAPRTFNQKHPINRNPGWYVRDQYERSILDYTVGELKQIGVEGYFLSPAHSEARSYIIKLIEEIIHNYDFDGLHLDYIRYPSGTFIYDVHLRSKFMKKYYFDPKDLGERSFLKERLGIWGYNDLTHQWHEFVNNDLTGFIRDVTKHVKTIKPDLLVSVAVKPNYGAARHRFHQDWLQWLNFGLVDFVCLMAYDKNIEMDLAELLEVVEEPHRVTVGLGLYLLSPKKIKEQVHLVNTFPYAGVVFFSYEELKRNRRYLNSLK